MTPSQSGGPVVKGRHVDTSETFQGFVTPNLCSYIMSIVHITLYYGVKHFLYLLRKYFIKGQSERSLTHFLNCLVYESSLSSSFVKSACRRTQNGRTYSQVSRIIDTRQSVKGIKLLALSILYLMIINTHRLSHDLIITTIYDKTRLDLLRVKNILSIIIDSRY